MQPQHHRVPPRQARLAFTLGFALALGLLAPASPGQAAAGHESCLMFLWCDPHEEKPGFLDGNEQFQGLAHDEGNWFISAGEYMHCGGGDTGDMTWGIWQLPVASAVNGGTPTQRFLISGRPDLQSYFHVGDIDCFNGFVLAPVENYDYWDLDGQPGPYWGQLHVGWLDNDGGRQDDLTLWHYTHTLRVDASNTGTQDGRPNQGFRTVGQAYDRICDGTCIRITPGVYHETLTLNKRVRLVSSGPGMVTIGSRP